MAEIGLRKADLDTPALWVDLARLERNIERIAAEVRSAGVGWRPHTKGIKTPAIAHQLLRAGALGITCAKLGEAEVMAAAGVRDILVANQVVGPQKVMRLAALQQQADVKAAVDNPDNVAAIGAAACALGVEVGLLIEVNTGMNRAGVAPGEPAVALARRIEATRGVRFRGLMSWEGHALALDDEEARRRCIVESIGLLAESVERCRQAGLPVEIVSAGGSGTYRITAHQPTITEVQAGGAIFGDQTYQQWGVTTEPALFIHARVTSRPAPNRIICDAGFKTATRGFLPPRPVDFPAASVALSAEHGIITLEAPDNCLQVGDTFDLVVGYSDATVYLHDTLYGVRNGMVEAAWEIQGRGKLR
ncbi:MAG TPA: alanine racemase [Caldilineaceae bacterium]|nr:alanine racemase [Caldilineaceae bacterium]